MQHHLRFILLSILLLSLMPGIPISHSARVTRGDGVITIHNIHLSEIATIEYRKGRHGYNKQALKEISRLLRCHYTHESHPIRTDLLELADQIQDNFDGRPIEVVSGFRSPAYNEQLWQMGHHVSRNSPHMYGQALDIRIPGITAKEIRDYADLIDKGGVGYYPSLDFVHIDVGVHRRW